MEFRVRAGDGANWREKDSWRGRALTLPRQSKLREGRRALRIAASPVCTWPYLSVRTSEGVLHA